jgi:hypothetical protein
MAPSQYVKCPVEMLLISEGGKRVHLNLSIDTPGFQVHPWACINNPNSFSYFRYLPTYSQVHRTTQNIISVHGSAPNMTKKLSNNLFTEKDLQIDIVSNLGYKNTTLLERVPAYDLGLTCNTPRDWHQY